MSVSLFIGIHCFVSGLLHIILVKDLLSEFKEDPHKSNVQRLCEYLFLFWIPIINVICLLIIFFIGYDRISDSVSKRILYKKNPHLLALLQYKEVCDIFYEFETYVPFEDAFSFNSWISDARRVSHYLNSNIHCDEFITLLDSYAPLFSEILELNRRNEKNPALAQNFHSVYRDVISLFMEDFFTLSYEGATR